MSIVVRLSPKSSVTAEKYDKSWEALEKAGLEFPPPVSTTTSAFLARMETSW